MRRVLFAAVGVLVVLGIVGALALRALLDPVMLGHTLESQATSWLGRPVHIGAARAHIFPTPRITLTAVGVAGPQALAADEVIVGAGLKALFQRRVEDAVIRVRNGTVTLNPGAPASKPAAPPLPSSSAPGSDAGSGTGSGGFTIASVAEIRFENVTVNGGGRSLRLDFDGSLTGDSLDVGRLSARSGQTSIEGKGTVSSLKKLDGTFDLSSTLLNAEDVLALLGAWLPSPPKGAGPTTAGSDGFGFGHIIVRAKVEKARALGYEIEHVTTALDLRGSRLTANPLTFELYGGRYDSTLVVDLATDRTAFDHKATLTGANVATLAQLMGHAGMASGTLHLTMHVRGAGRDFAAAAHAAGGEASADVRDGTLQGLDVVRQTFVVLGTAAPPDSGKRFDSVSAKLSLAGGSMTADDVAMHAPDFDLRGHARVAENNALGGQAELTLSEALSKEAQGKNKDLKLMFENGRIALPVTLSGTLLQPRVTPDMGNLLGRAAMNKMKAEINKATKGGVDSLLSGIFRKPK